MKAYRCGGHDGLNEFPHRGQQELFTTGSGPQNCETHLDACIEKLRAMPKGWLIYNTHGLDNEGWGPIRAEYLDSLLERLVEIESVEILPAGKALDQYAGS